MPSPDVQSAITALGIDEESAARLTRVLAKVSSPLKRFAHAMAVLSGVLSPQGVIDFLRSVDYWPGVRP